MHTMETDNHHSIMDHRNNNPSPSNHMITQHHPQNLVSSPSPQHFTSIDEGIGSMSIEQRDSIVDDLLAEYRARTQSKTTPIPTPTSNAAHSQNQHLPQSQYQNHISNGHDVESNFFSNLTNVSYGAYMVEDLDHHQNDDHDDHDGDDQNQHSNHHHHQQQQRDWIDTLDTRHFTKYSNPNNELEQCPPSMTDIMYINNHCNNTMATMSPQNGSKNAMQRNLRNLKQKTKRQKQRLEITRPSDYVQCQSATNRKRSRSRNERNGINPRNGTKTKNERIRSGSLPPKRQQSVAQEMERKEEENMTFKPKINDYDFNRQIDPDVQRRLEIWEIQRKIKLKQQRKQKSQEEAFKMKETATFQPEVKMPVRCRRRKRGHSSNDGVDGVHNESKISIDSRLPVQDRLYEREHQRIEKLAKTKQIIECQEMEQCSFRPKLRRNKNVSRSKKKREPIWKRQDEINRHKATQRMASKQKVLMQQDSDLTFKPKINRKSVAMVEAVKQQTAYYPVAVAERLTLQNYKNKKKLEEQQEVEAKQEGKPSINPTSKKILKESILFREASSNFFERQKIYELERRMKEAEQQRLERQQSNGNDDERNPPFRPNIGNADAVLSRSKRHRHRYQYEDPQQRYQRLAFHDSEVIERKTRLKAAELEKENTFKPRINKKSAKMGRPSSVFELFQPEKSMKLKDRIQEEAQRVFEAEHPFKPQYQRDVVVPLTPNHDHKSRSRSRCRRSQQPQRPQTAGAVAIKKKKAAKSRCFSMKYGNYESTKKQKLLEARKQLDALKMAECTFAPQTNHGKKRKRKRREKKDAENGFERKNKIIISGWDRFKELKEMAMRKQQEIEERKQEVFRVNGNVLRSRKRNASGSLQTVTQPFKLHSKRGDHKTGSGSTANDHRHHRSDGMGMGMASDLEQPLRTAVSKQREMAWNILRNGLEDDDGSSSFANYTETLSLDSLLPFDLESDLVSSSESV